MADRGDRSVRGGREFRGPVRRWESRRGGFEDIVGDRARKAKGARKIFFLYRGQLDVSHLVLGNLECLRSVSLFFAGGVGSHSRFGLAGSGAATNRKNCKQRRSEQAKQRVREPSAMIGHGRFLVPTAWRICSRASM